MLLQILQKQLDESTTCPLCQAAMYWVEAEQYDQDVQFHECSHCLHRVFQSDKFTCHCDSCASKRKKLLQETRLQEQRKLKKKEIVELELRQLSFLHKLFLLSILDNQIQEYSVHDEFIHWEKIKYQPITKTKINRIFKII